MKRCVLPMADRRRRTVVGHGSRRGWRGRRRPWRGGRDRQEPGGRAPRGVVRPVRLVGPQRRRRGRLAGQGLGGGERHGPGRRGTRRVSEINGLARGWHGPVRRRPGQERGRVWHGKAGSAAERRKASRSIHLRAITALIACSAGGDEQRGWLTRVRDRQKPRHAWRLAPKTVLAHRM